MKALSFGGNKKGNKAEQHVHSKSCSALTKGDIIDHERLIMEGFLLLRIHVRRRRYCVLWGRMLHVFKSKDESRTPQGQLAVAKKVIDVVGAKDAMELDKNIRTAVLGHGKSWSTENVLVISTKKSKLVVVEAETNTEKLRWVHAMNSLNFASIASERTFFLSIVEDCAGFDAHLAVSLLHKYRDNVIATELVIDRLAEYAEQNIDDVEFYIQQIMHLVVNSEEMAKTGKLVHLLLSICKAKAYVEQLGNCIHLALQLFWLLEAKIADKDPKTYNLCAKLLMSIEAKVVNQFFEVPAVYSKESLSTMLLHIPGMKERLRAASQENQLQQGKDEVEGTARTPEETRISSSTQSTQQPSTSEHGSLQQREFLLSWMEKERQKRYKYFHHQRDFVNALTDISEKMRFIEPPNDRKKHLPASLEALFVPDMAYIPLGRVSDPFCRILRVLKDEGTVFSTHSRAPCLLCFEVIEDDVNAAGHRGPVLRLHERTTPGSNTNTSQRTLARASLSSFSSSLVDEETEVANYVRKCAINGKVINVNVSDETFDDEDEEPDDLKSEQNCDSSLQSDELRVAESTNNANNAEVLDSVLGIPVHFPEETELSMVVLENMPGQPSDNEGCSPPTSPRDPDYPKTTEQRELIRHHSRTAYELGLSKVLSESAAFGETWKATKERIRSSSQDGHLPGWNVISVISKSNDDLRQEVFAMQLITKFQDIFKESNLPLYLRAYRIVSTGKSSGLIETITDAQSLDSLKKRKDYTGLRDHFERTYGKPTDSDSCAGKQHPLRVAQRNFLHSLVAYSIVCYLLQIKDRHNGNIMLDTQGHLVHIDFGFMLGIAPGGTWSLETAPFKLTKEMVSVLDGVESPLFGEFVHLFARGLLAAQRNADKIITLVEIMMRNSTFPCFQNRDVQKDLQKLRDRFLLQMSTERVVKTAIRFINSSYKNKWTKRYDQFQKFTNGILP